MGLFQDHEPHHYEYYIKDGKTPIRLVLDKGHHTLGAEGFDADKGIFLESAILLNDVQRHPYIEEVSSSDFYAFCEKLSRGL